MTSKRKEFSLLLDRYDELRDGLMEHTMNHFDSMGYDINGYIYDEDNDIENLKQQVRAFELMLEAYKLLNYKYA